MTTVDESLFGTGADDAEGSGESGSSADSPDSPEAEFTFVAPPPDPMDLRLGTEQVAESPARVAPSRWVREVVFREKVRGYRQGDVDAFLDQVAFAFDELEARLRDAEERASRAAGEIAVAVADDDTVRRTLTLAQRTAELAIAEAERQAAEMVERARIESEMLVHAAEAESAAIRDRERSQLVAEIAHLESARSAAAEDLESLETRRAQEHERLTRVLEELAHVVERRLT